MQMQSIPGQWNEISGGYNLPANAIGSKVGGGYLYAPTVLGATTGGTPTSAPTPQPESQPAPVDPYAGIRNEISSGWDQYIASLDQQLGPLGEQKTAQENIVGEQATQGLNTLGLQRTQGLQELGTQRTRAEQNQAKNLRDLASNVTNAMRAGNIYLGARGAGDSSAANMYSYALTKLGTRERSNVMQNTADIMNEISGRETNLNNIYNSEVKQIESEKNAQLNSIAQWYASAVQTLQQQKAQGELGKSQDLANLSKDILNQAMTALSTLQQYAISKRQALDQWAMNNADTIAQVKSNLQQVSAFSPQLPQAGNIVGTPQVSGLNMFTPAYGGYATEEESRMGLA